MLQNSSLYKADDIVTIVLNDGSKTGNAAAKSISQCFLSVETPFKWQPRRFEDVSADDVIECAKEKAEYDDLPIDKFVRLVTLVYEYTHQTKYDEAMEMIVVAGSLIKKEKETDGKKYQEFKHAMGHVHMATQAFVLALQGYETLAKKAYEDIYPISDMGATDMACIHAIKAKFFSLYRKEGFQQAVESSRKALELNPEEPMWMYLLAESLRRKEKYFPSFEIPMEELQLLEQAVSRDHNAWYLVHLALRYNNCAANALSKHKNEPEFYQSDLFKTIKSMQRTATDLYKEALMLEPDDEIVNRRCGFGLMKASAKVARENKHLIKIALDKALSLSPTSSMTLHYLGKYYKILESNEAKALDCFQRATQSGTNLPAYCDLIKLKFEMYGLEEYNPIHDFEIMLKQHEEIDPYNKLIIMCHIASYYLMVHKDLEKAMKYFIPVLEQDKDHVILKYHKSLLLDNHQKGIIDLGEILANEIKRTDENKLPNKYQLMKMIANVSTDYLLKPVNEHLIDEMMDKYAIRKINRHRKSTMTNKKSPSELNWRSRNEDSNSSPSNSYNIGSSQPWRSGSARRTDTRRYTRSPDNNSNWRIRSEENEKDQKVIENWRTETTPLRNTSSDKPSEEPLSWRKPNIK